MMAKTFLFEHGRAGHHSFGCAGAQVVGALLLCAAWSGLVVAQDSGDPVDVRVYRIDDQSLELKSGPGKDFKTVGTVLKDQKLIVVDKQAEWYRVEVPQGFIAYVHGRYVQPIRHGWGRITSNRINVRPDPASDGSNLPIDAISEGTEIILLEEIEGWYKIVAPPTVRPWVKGNLVEVGTPEDHKDELIDARRDAEKEFIALLGPDPADVEKQRLHEERAAALTTIEADLTNLEGSLEGDAPPSAESVDPMLEQLVAIETAATDEEQKATATALHERAVALKGKIAALPTEPAVEPVVENEETVKPVTPPSKRRHRESHEYGEFTGVGWVRNVTHDREAPVHLRKGGETVFRIVCRDRRFRLADFANKEIGVFGKVTTVEGAPDLIEVERLVILSGR